MPIPTECILGVQVSCCGCAEGKQESIAASNCIATSWAWKVCTAGEEEWYACRRKPQAYQPSSTFGMLYI